jgi:predicted dehydrogenase
MRAGGEVAAIVDPDYGRALALGSRYGDAATARGIDEIYSAGAYDVAHICTPLDTHEELTHAALAAGCHVLVEKPLAPTAHVAGELHAKADERGLLLCPVHQFPFQKAIIQLERSLPRIGRIRHLDYVACSAGSENGTADARDALVLDILPHPLSLFSRLLTTPLSDMEWHVLHAEPGEVRISGGADAVTVGVLVSAAGRPTRNTLRIIAEHGTAHVDLFHGFAVVESGSVSRARKIARPFLLSAKTVGNGSANLIGRTLRREPAYPGLRELIHRFYTSVHGAEPTPITSEESLEIAAARDLLANLA